MSVRVEGLSVELAGERILDALALTLEPGSLVALIGPPGAGKTVLLKVIAGLLRPARGKVLVEGEDFAALSELRLSELRRRIGMVFQNNALFDSRTIFENVAFPLRRALDPPPEQEIQRRVRARLADVGLSGSESLFPHELSGGMQKRAGIARATVFGPRIRLYDEPTAGLDPVTSARILGLVQSIHSQDPTGVSVVVSNEMDTLLRTVPRAVMLHQRGIAFDGPVAELGPAGHAPELVRKFVAGDVDAAI
jgi:phospholipid/cholesterol/gamma-HCH transport system ATP-binding protein